MPSAMAALETMMTSPPSRTNSESWRHHSPIATSSSPRPSLVTRLEPTLTTMRRASRNTSDLVRMVMFTSGPCQSYANSYQTNSNLELIGSHHKTRINDFRRLFGFLLRLDVLVNNFDHGFTAFTGEGRNLEHRAFELEAFDKVLDQCGTLLERDHVKLIEHQPARLG